MGKASRKDGCVVLRHARTCSKMSRQRGGVLKAGAYTLAGRWHTQEGRARTHVLPWVAPSSRRGENSSETHRRKNRAPHKGKWSPRGTGDDSPHLSRNAPGQQAWLVRTVNIQVRWAARSSCTRPSAPGYGDTSKAVAIACSVLGGSSRLT